MHNKYDWVILICKCIYFKKEIFNVFSLQVFALGTNCSGCLGLGDLQSTIEPRRIDVLCGKKIVSLSYGTGPHVVIATAGNVAPKPFFLFVSPRRNVFRRQRNKITSKWVQTCKMHILFDILFLFCATIGFILYLVFFVFLSVILFGQSGLLGQEMWLHAYLNYD